LSCEGVQHCLRFCLHHLSCVKMTPFQFYLHSGKQKNKVGGGTKVMLFLVKNSLMKKNVWNGTLSWCYSQFFCRQSSERSLRTFSRSLHKTSQY
jgi:hypothetical protein